MTAITQTEFDNLLDSHWTGGPFNGYSYSGYIGDSQRNYITDAWVLTGANALGWSVAALSEWMTSKCGRWALDSQPWTPEEMQTQMAEADVDELITETLDRVFGH